MIWRAPGFCSTDSASCLALLLLFLKLLFTPLYQQVHSARAIIQLHIHAGQRQAINANFRYSRAASSLSASSSIRPVNSSASSRLTMRWLCYALSSSVRLPHRLRKRVHQFVSASLPFSMAASRSFLLCAIAAVISLIFIIYAVCSALASVRRMMAGLLFSLITILSL